MRAALQCGGRLLLDWKAMGHVGRQLYRRIREDAQGIIFWNPQMKFGPQEPWVQFALRCIERMA